MVVQVLTSLKVLSVMYQLIQVRLRHFFLTIIMKTTIQNQRLSVMGVDTDEEAMDLMKFQQSYNLNSKMMSVMNEIYDKLINQTGL